MGRKVSFSPIGESSVHRHVRQVEQPAHWAWLGGWELALCLEFAQCAMRGHAGDGR